MLRWLFKNKLKAPIAQQLRDARHSLLQAKNILTKETNEAKYIYAKAMTASVKETAEKFDVSPENVLSASSLSWRQLCDGVDTFDDAAYRVVQLRNKGNASNHNFGQTIGFSYLILAILFNARFLEIQAEGSQKSELQEVYLSVSMLARILYEVGEDKRAPADIDLWLMEK